MKGQMTLDKKTMSWTHTPINKMTMRTAGQNNTIQSREGWFKAWSGHLTMNCNTLEEAILWIEKKA